MSKRRPFQRFGVQSLTVRKDDPTGTRVLNRDRLSGMAGFGPECKGGNGVLSRSPWAGGSGRGVRQNNGRNLSPNRNIIRRFY